MLKKFNAVLKSKKIKYFYYGIISLILTIALIVFLAYQFYLIPNVESYKQKIENFIEKETGGKAEIKTLNVLWNITNPKFQIRNFSITDKDNNKTIIDVDKKPLIKPINSLDVKHSERKRGNANML